MSTFDWWTYKDAERAALDGWYLVETNNQPRRTTGGKLTHATQVALYDFILEQSFEDDWYARVVEDIGWGINLAMIAIADGWFYNPALGQIFGADSKKFKTRQAALDHVLKGAQEGKPLCKKAILMVAARRMQEGSKPSHGYSSNH